MLGFGGDFRCLGSTRLRLVQVQLFTSEFAGLTRHGASDAHSFLKTANDSVFDVSWYLLVFINLVINPQDVVLNLEPLMHDVYKEFRLLAKDLDSQLRQRNSRLLVFQGVRTPAETDPMHPNAILIF